MSEEEEKKNNRVTRIEGVYPIRNNIKARTDLSKQKKDRDGSGFRAVFDEEVRKLKEKDNDKKKDSNENELG